MKDRKFYNESIESMIARNLLELVWYDNGGLAHLKKGDFTRYKKRIQGIIKKLPMEVVDLLADDEFAEDFAIGEETEMQNTIATYPSLKPINDLLNEFFDG